jgi:FtsH-binding integral membrane protein
MQKSSSCASQAMLLVAVQIGLIFASLSAARKNALWLSRASSWQATLLSLVLMLGGVAGLAARQSLAITVGAWCCFTTGALILGLQLARYDAKALRRGLLQATLLLLVVAAVAPFAGYFSDATNLLVLLTLALLVGLVVLCVWPSSVWESVLSAAGSVLFATWTVYDVVQRPCESPWSKSVEVFLDIFNLFVFSVR